MRRMTFTFSLSLLVSLVIIFASCSKEGSTGPAGDTGPAGAPGSQGPKGDTGVANVIYSAWLDVAYAPVTDTTPGPTLGDTLGYTAVIPADKLTADLLSSGEIKVYFNFNTAADPLVVPVPFNQNFYIDVIFATGQIGLSSNIDAGTLTDNGEKFGQYRYILIPGGVNTLGTVDIDWKDYNKVKQYLNIKD